MNSTGLLMAKNGRRNTLFQLITYYLIFMISTILKSFSRIYYFTGSRDTYNMYYCSYKLKRSETSYITDLDLCCTRADFLGTLCSASQHARSYVASVCMHSYRFLRYFFSASQHARSYLASVCMHFLCFVPSTLPLDLVS